MRAHAQTAPGGISTNLDLWLKADAGVTESSGDVSAWDDQSTNTNHATQGTGSLQPGYVASVLNYNPGFLFDGVDDYLGTALDISGTTLPDVTVFAVYRSLGAASGAPWGEYDGTADRLIHNHSGEDTNVGDGSGFEVVSGLIPTDQAMVGTVVYDEDAASGSYVFGNGAQLAQFSANHDPGTSNPLQIGAVGDGLLPFNGYIYEVIVISSVLSTQDFEQVESYLAIKYGVTLDHNYFASDGTVVRSLGGTYDFHIGVIGRDDDSGLNQKQTMSSETGALVTIALGSYAVDNASNANTFPSDLQFFAWADDNTSTTVATPVAGSDANVRMERVWKIKEVNGVGTVEVRIPDSYGVTHLVSDDNSSFTSPTETLLSSNGDGTVSATIDFANGDFFSFGAFQEAPGGEIADLQLWFKADAGVSETSGDVSAWSDQSINANDASQGTGGNQPVIVDAAQNYNPGLLFDGSDDYLDTALDISAATLPDITVFAVYTSLGAAAGAPWGEYDGTADRLIHNNSGEDTNVGDGSGFEVVSGLFAIDQPMVGTVIYGEDAANGSYVYGNGTQLAQFTANHDPGTSNTLQIGAVGDGLLSFNGYIYEVILHDISLATQEREEIESYLAIKYGITLTHDYFASDGTSLWDLATFGAYYNGVSGIGRDDVSTLDQRQSTAGDVVEIGLGALAIDNASNANAFGSNLSFMMWGHDDASTDMNTAVAGTDANVRMGRTWTVAETGTVGDVEIQLSDVFGATHLLVDDNSSFTSPTETALTDNSDGTWSATVNLADGDYFSFGAFALAPAGAVANLQLWLRSDAGTSTTSDGGTITAWLDQGLYALDAGTGAGTITFESDAAKLVNYQPVLEFNGTVDRLDGSDLDMDDDTAVSAFYVLIDRGSTDNHTAFTFSGSDSDHRLEFDDTRWGIWDENTLTMGTSPFGTGYQWAVITEHYDGTTASVYANGVLGTAEARTNGIDLDGGSFYTIGSSATTTDSGIFDIAEVIIYTDAMSADMERIQSYLGIKYSITMPHDYTSASGVTLWDATANAAYQYDVAGIGRDDVSGLDQRQSADSVMAIGLTAIAADNASNSNTFTADGTFLMWGHDDGPLTEADVMFGASDAKMLNRVWFVKETGDTGSLELQFNVSAANVTGTTASDFWLVVDTDTDPTNGNRMMVQASSFGSDVASFTGIDLEDDDYLLLVTENPGDVTLPVELVSFEAVYDNDKVELAWSTASETNNAGFEIERRVESREGNVEWRMVDFVEGRGTSDATTYYTYSDNLRSVRGTTVAYRLKQLDFDGSFHTSEAAVVTLPAPQAYDVTSYPNPFNPVATIEYDVPVEGHIKVLVYDAQGREIATLVNETQVAGRYRVNFDATGLASGVYVYRMEAAGKSFSKTMMLVK